MVEAHAAPLLVVSACYLVLPIELLWRPSHTLPPTSSNQGIKYRWYLRCMRLATALCVLVCVGLPVVIIAGSDWPCATLFALRVVIPSCTTGLVLIAHISVLLAWSMTNLFAQLADPRAPSRVVLRQLQSLRTHVAPARFFCASTTFFIVVLSPYLFVDPPIFALDVATCQGDARYHAIATTQLVPSFITTVLACIVGCRYRRAIDDPSMGFIKAYVRTLCSALVTSLLLLLVGVAPAHWTLWRYYVDDIAVTWLHFAVVGVFLHSHRAVGYGNKVLATGPHISSVASVAGVEYDRTTVAADLAEFLSDPDHYDHFLGFCLARHEVNEVLAWKVIAHYRHETIPAAMVYDECMGPGAVLITAIGRDLGPRTLAALAAPLPNTLDEIFAELSYKLLLHVGDALLPSYRRSAKQWDVFVQRSSIIKRYQQPTQAVLGESASNLALRASSERESNNSCQSTTNGPRSFRLGDVVTPEALGLPATPSPPPRAVAPKLSKDRRENTLARQSTQDILRGIQTQCSP
ncbi:hypothetical protein SDRG_14068 [Saprolegnia diclina VS20]|uniref:RGS domain-containing protein n=1 Tax=Saprolegnia diclina (strain VS20) TaxID=1156394 RepID=T0Q485_SAPDV|nr:hypothetical protein SDRG_14068 [Saprolegnia diclina VS20]EQC28245.1 hypothetical protein SDRG_14068 [Saprolegnia diclina VS20]|eukprot:XP_008618394.1 hypothetical protein SDRG_14068 [Saprolegnia diclina VS20]